MEIVFVAVLFVAVTAVVIRVAAGFLRWTRKNAPEAGSWAIGVYHRASLGDWVERTSEPHHRHSSDASHQPHPHHTDTGHHHGHHHESPGFHGGHDGGHGHF